jgi:TolA-binding protein
MAGTGASGDKDSAANGATSTSAAAVPAAKADPSSKAEASSLEIENELQQLRDLLETQSKQIQQQNEQLREQQEQMRSLENQLTAVNAARDNSGADAVATPVTGVIGPTTGVVSNATANSGSNQDKTTPPTSINIKGISLTPMGFMAAETVWRQKALASDVNSAFSATPFNGSPAASMSEFQASGRQSRIAMLVEGKLANVKIGGYYETDFLSAGTTSTNTQSNSYTLRQRQFWAQAAFNNGITFTGGQQWSLITETIHGMDNRTEALPMTIDAQYQVGFSWARQYGARITKNFGNKFWLGFAVEEAVDSVKVHGNPTVACAPAVTTIVAGAAVVTPATCPSGFNGTLVTVPAPTVANPAATATATVNNTTYNNFLLGAFGTSGGLYNPLGNYAYNPSPDLVFKAVFEPGGAWGHYEIFGIFSDFRDRIYPCVPVNGGTALPASCPATLTTIIGSGAGAFNNSRTGGGAGANARWNLFAKKVDIGFHFLGGDGIARYGSSGALSDATVRPNGTLAPIHNFQSLGTLQFHPTPKLDIYMNVGGEYEARTDYAKSGTPPLFSGTPNEGYGYPGLANYGCWSETLPISAPAATSNLAIPTGVGGSTGFIPGALNSCTGDPRNIIEGTLGFWYRFYKGPKGTFQYGMQYSNYVVNAWRGVGSGTINGIAVTTSGQPHADNNMVFTSFRYYLP